MRLVLRTFQMKTQEINIFKKAVASCQLISYKQMQGQKCKGEFTMEEKRALAFEESENKEQKLQEEKLNQVSGGGIAIRPSGNNQPRQSDDGNLL